jgi:putative endonuclease
LDIVARHRGALVFVEVKTRHDVRFGGGEEAVTALKRRRMVRLAHDYLARHNAPECACRFDVVSIMLDGEQPVIEVFENAFADG